MDDGETLIEALHTLYTRLGALRTLEGSEMLLSGRVESYRSAFEDAYAAYGKIETVVDVLGHELDYQHTRLDTPTNCATHEVRNEIRMGRSKQQRKQQGFIP